MSFWSKLINKFTPSDGGTEIDWEALLIEADLGMVLTQKLVSGLEERHLLKKNLEAQAFIKSELQRLMVMAGPPPLPLTKPQVILLVGVNGSGKTTSAAKLAAQAVQQGRKVCLAAADTFRAAAVDQLQVWGERLGVPVVTAPAGSDPATVTFKAHEQAVQDEADLLIVDTAGRLPNKNNLMLEIAKVKRILQKRDATAPHHVWLVVDGTTGSNILHQAREFHQAVGLTGLIMTKLDSSAKGGMIAAVKLELQIPTVYIGHGEAVEDLARFDGARFVEEFFA